MGADSTRFSPDATAEPAVDPREVRSFAEFYPYYLSEHRHRLCRRMHFAGSSLALLCLALLVVTEEPSFLVYAVVLGYGFAWVGHALFEKNRPATFRRPLYSLMGDALMYRDMWLGRITF